MTNTEVFITCAEIYRKRKEFENCAKVWNVRRVEVGIDVLYAHRYLSLPYQFMEQSPLYTSSELDVMIVTFTRVVLFERPRAAVARLGSHLHHS